MEKKQMTERQQKAFPELATKMREMPFVVFLSFVFFP